MVGLAPRRLRAGDAEGIAATTPGGRRVRSALARLRRGAPPDLVARDRWRGGAADRHRFAAVVLARPSVLRSGSAGCPKRAAAYRRGGAEADARRAGAHPGRRR